MAKREVGIEDGRISMRCVILLLTVLVTSAAIALNPVLAFNEADLQKLKTTKACAGCDLSYADLPGFDLSHANLSGANLYGANLSGADLTYADLSTADVSAADLTGADLSDATWFDGSWCRAGSKGSCSR
jgi:uncharacterized protein YjbI with pentapeptide repeats